MEERVAGDNETATVTVAMDNGETETTQATEFLLVAVTEKGTPRCKVEYHQLGSDVDTAHLLGFLLANVHPRVVEHAKNFATCLRYALQDQKAVDALNRAQDLEAMCKTASREAHRIMEERATARRSVFDPGRAGDTRN